MDTADPDRLVFSYTRIMAAFPHFVPAPRTIGILGLGGGSLVKHCYRHHPTSQIRVAELSPEVIALRHSFHIPDDSSRLTILQADAADVVRQSPNTFDALLVDVFDEAGFLPRLATRRFYQDCHRALTPGGVLVLNFSGNNWRAASARLARIFRGNLALYTCPDGDNVIAFATRAPHTRTT